MRTRLRRKRPLDARSSAWTKPRPAPIEEAAPPSTGFDFGSIRIGAPRPFPHRETIEPGLGRPIPGGAVTDARSCDERGVQAFTERDTAVFRSSTPPLHVAAHEAAHLVQHAGETRDAGLGPEGHAHAVADAIATGGGARDLLGGGGRLVGGAVHAYTDVPENKQAPGYWNAGVKTLRVSDDRRLAVASNAKSFWADPPLVDESNKELKKIGSPLRLTPTANTLEGPGLTPGEKRSLTKVSLLNICTQTSGSGFTAYEQCDLNALDVMGAGPKETQKVKTKDPSLENLTAVYKDPHTAFGVVPMEQSKTIASTDQGMAEEILAKYPGGKAAYDKASDADKAKFDQKMGINQAAAPGVGQGFLITRMGPTKSGDYRHHAAPVIARSGGDSVTMEAVADKNNVYIYADPSKRWWFDMYGTAAGQTFGDRWGGEFGSGAVTMTVGALPLSDRSQIALAEAYDPLKLIKKLGPTLDGDVKTLIMQLAVLLFAWIVNHEPDKASGARAKLTSARASIAKRAGGLDWSARQEYLTYSSAIDRVIEAVNLHEYTKSEASRWEGAVERMTALIHSKF